MGIIKYFRKKYWEAAIFRGGRRIPFTCDGLTAVPDSAYALFTEKELEKYAEQATKYAQISSEREKIAQKVEREAVEIKKAEYMQNKIGNEYQGIVSGITAFGMFVELENTVEGLIKFEDLGNEYFIYNDENKTLIGEHTKKVYKIGDKVKIKVIYADKQLRRINFKLI